MFIYYQQISDDDNDDLAPFFNALGNIPYKGKLAGFISHLHRFIKKYIDTEWFFDQTEIDIEHPGKVTADNHTLI